MSTDAPLLPDPAELPDDPVFLKRLVVQLFELLRQRDQRLSKLEHHLDVLLKKVFGRTSEKFDPRQLALFDAQSDESQADAATLAAANAALATNAAGDNAVTTNTDSRTPPATPGHGRRRAPDTLKRVEVIHDLSDAQKTTLGGAENLQFLGDEITEQYEWEPSSLFVIVHVQKKYARRERLLVTNDNDPLQQNVIVAPKPPQPIPGGEAGPGLLAQVLVSKYGDHLPLFRLERIFGRHGVRFARQTTCDWCAACAELLKPLTDLIRQTVLASRVLHTDDTPVKLRDAHAADQCTARFWTYVGDEQHPLIFYDFTRSRERDGPARVLANYRGYLQADAFSAYDGLYLKSDGAIVEVACWAHARRKFHESLPTDSARAAIALTHIRQLYAVEKQIRELLAGEWSTLLSADRFARIAAHRQEHSRPLLAAFRTWLDDTAAVVLPKSPLAAAIRYALNQWEALGRYTEDGQLAIDNNAAERSLRGIAIGRKNWLFVGSERGGHTAATILTLITSAIRHHLDPFAYLRDVLRRLPTTEPANLTNLLPNRWRPE